MTFNIDSYEKMAKYALGVKSMRLKYDRWLQTVLTNIVDEEIIQPIKEAMLSHEYSQKIIDGTDIEEIITMGRLVRIKIKSEYFADLGDGEYFDVALAREEGTEDHWVEPLRYPTALRDPQTGATSEKPTPEQTKDEGVRALHWVSKWGEHMFSTGHVVGGIPARHLVKMIVDRNKGKVIERIKTEFQAWKNEILKT